VTAKTKLNEAYLFGSLILAGIIGLLAQSFFIFIIAASVIIAVEIISGSIRLDQNKF